MAFKIDWGHEKEIVVEFIKKEIEILFNRFTNRHFSFGMN